MHLKTRFAAVLIAASSLSAGHAPAMDFLFFARMDIDDQATYVTSLVEGTAKMLRATGHPDEAQKAVALFKDSTDRGGVHQLAMNMKAMAQTNLRNQDNPHSLAQVYDVEAAMQLTLKNNGIPVPLKYLETINRNFAPSLPLRHASGG